VGNDATTHLVERHFQLASLGPAVACFVLKIQFDKKKLLINLPFLQLVPEGPEARRNKEEQVCMAVPAARD
jgi:hypothetical protein